MYLFLASEPAAFVNGAVVGVDGGLGSSATPPAPPGPRASSRRRCWRACVFLFLADQPLLYSHQYTYFTARLRIAEHPHPLATCWAATSGASGTSTGRSRRCTTCSRPPCFKLFGAASRRAAARPVRAGSRRRGRRRLAGPARGRTARRCGRASRTPCTGPRRDADLDDDRERAHGAVRLGGRAARARDGQPSRPLAFAGGALVGLAALARSVSTVFLGLAALQRAYAERSRRGLVSAALVLAGGACSDPALDGAQRVPHRRARAHRDRRVREHLVREPPGRPPDVPGAGARGARTADARGQARPGARVRAATASASGRPPSRTRSARTSGTSCGSRGCTTSCESSARWSRGATPARSCSTTSSCWPASPSSWSSRSRAGRRPRGG